MQQGLFHPPLAVTAVVVAAQAVCYPAVLALAIFGIARLCRRDWAAGFVPLLVILFVSALHAIVFGHPRYRLPLTPLLGVYAGAAVAGGPWWKPGSRRRFSLAVATVVVVLVIWVAQFAWRDWAYAERALGLVGLS